MFIILIFTNIIYAVAAMAIVAVGRWGVVVEGMWWIGIGFICSYKSCIILV